MTDHTSYQVQVTKDWQLVLPAETAQGDYAPLTSCTLTYQAKVEGVLLLYGISRWEVVEKQIISLPALEPASRNVARIMLGYAEEISLDEQGGFYIPEKLRFVLANDKTIFVHARFPERHLQLSTFPEYFDMG
jgi:DNA-binding transcriptional regulator/RsmH inhibitor MraZ